MWCNEKHNFPSDSARRVGCGVGPRRSLIGSDLRFATPKPLDDLEPLAYTVLHFTGGGGAPRDS